MTSTAVQPADELRIAISIGTGFQTTIQHADSKAGMVAVMCSGLVTLLITQQDKISTVLRTGRDTAPWLVLALVAGGSALVATGFSLVATVWPRLDPPAHANRFAFPAFAVAGASGLGATSTEELCAQAWDLNRRLAAIAMNKHRHVSASLAGVCTATVAAIAAVVLSAI